MKLAALSLFCLASLSQAGASSYFVPEHRLAGIGVDRDGLSDDALATRTRLMVESQTFIIMREPKAVAGAKRVTTDRKLQTVFRAAAAASGFPQDVLEAIAYLESWGDVSAESWAGSPRGIMQISLATARTMGLKVGQVPSLGSIWMARWSCASASGSRCRIRYSCPRAMAASFDFGSFATASFMTCSAPATSFWESLTLASSMEDFRLFGAARSALM